MNRPSSNRILIFDKKLLVILLGRYAPFLMFEDVLRAHKISIMNGNRERIEAVITIILYIELIPSFIRITNKKLDGNQK